jgi:hypothetical protein
MKPIDREEAGTRRLAEGDSHDRGDPGKSTAARHSHEVVTCLHKARYDVSRPPARAGSQRECRSAAPRIPGSISIGLARTLKVLDPELRNRQTGHWEQAVKIFDLLL